MDLETYLKEKNIWFRLIDKEETVHTSDASAATGIPLERITKSLVFLADSRPIMAIIPGNCKVNIEKIKIILEAKSVKIVPFDSAKEYSGYEPGGTPPVCHKNVEKVIIDKKLMQYETVYGGGGSRGKLIELKVSDIINLNKAIISDISLKN